MDNQKNPRTRLFWNSEFRDILKQELPEISKAFEEDLDISNLSLPKIRFEKENSLTFKVNIIKLKEIELDTDSEKSEEAYEIDINSIENRPEGKVIFTYSKKYERDPQNRAKAIAYHGSKCILCGFDFEEVYGARGKGYIEIHHINPLSSVGEEKEINPITDLIPVCANCHRMIHRRKNDVLSIDLMKKLIKRCKEK